MVGNLVQKSICDVDCFGSPRNAEESSGDAEKIPKKDLSEDDLSLDDDWDIGRRKSLFG